MLNKDEKFNYESLKATIDKHGSIEELMPSIREVPGFIDLKAGLDSLPEPAMWRREELSVNHFDKFKTSDDNLRFAVQTDKSIVLVGDKGSTLEITDYGSKTTALKNHADSVEKLCTLLNGELPEYHFYYKPDKSLDVTTTEDGMRMLRFNRHSLSHTGRLKELKTAIMNDDSLINILPSLSRSLGFISFDRVNDSLNESSKVKRHSTAEEYFSNYNKSNDELLFAIKTENSMVLVGEKGNTVELTLSNWEVKADDSEINNMSKLSKLLKEDKRAFGLRRALTGIGASKDMGLIPKHFEEPDYKENNNSKSKRVDIINQYVKQSETSPNLEITGRYIENIKKSKQNITDPKFNTDALKALISKENSLASLMPEIRNLRNFIPYESINESLSGTLSHNIKLDNPSEVYFEKFKSSDDNLLFAMKVDASVILIGDKGSVVQLDVTGSVNTNLNPSEDLSRVCEVLNNGDMKNSFERYMDKVSDEVEESKTLEYLINPNIDNERKSTYHYEKIIELIRDEGSIASVLPSIMEHSPNFIPLDKIPKFLVNAEDVFDKHKDCDDKLLFGVLREDENKNNQIVLIGEKANIVRVPLNGDMPLTNSGRFDNIRAVCWSLNNEAKQFTAENSLNEEGNIQDNSSDDSDNFNPSPR
jgi:hypothetical protein